METLRDKWKGGRLGTLCAMEQAKVWALREVMKDTDEGVNYEAIAEKVVKIAPKGKKGGHPNRNAIRKLIERMDGDDEWFPGKRPEAAYGRPATLTPGKRKASGTHLSDNDVCVQGWLGEQLWESNPRMCLSNPRMAVR